MKTTDLLSRTQYLTIPKDTCGDMQAYKEFNYCQSSSNERIASFNKSCKSSYISSISSIMSLFSLETNIFHSCDKMYCQNNEFFGLERREPELLGGGLLSRFIPLQDSMSEIRLFYDVLKLLYDIVYFPSNTFNERYLKKNLAKFIKKCNLGFEYDIRDVKTEVYTIFNLSKNCIISCIDADIGQIFNIPVTSRNIHPLHNSSNISRSINTDNKSIRSSEQQLNSSLIVPLSSLNSIECKEEKRKKRKSAGDEKRDGRSSSLCTISRKDNILDNNLLITEVSCDALIERSLERYIGVNLLAYLFINVDKGIETSALRNGEPKIPKLYNSGLMVLEEIIESFVNIEGSLEFDKEWDKAFYHMVKEKVYFKHIKEISVYVFTYFVSRCDDEIKLSTLTKYLLLKIGYFYANQGSKIRPRLKNFVREDILHSVSPVYIFEMFVKLIPSKYIFVLVNEIFDRLKSLQTSRISYCRKGCGNDNLQHEMFCFDAIETILRFTLSINIYKIIHELIYIIIRMVLEVIEDADFSCIAYENIKTDVTFSKIKEIFVNIVRCNDNFINYYFHIIFFVFNKLSVIKDTFSSKKEHDDQFHYADSVRLMSDILICDIIISMNCKYTSLMRSEMRGGFSKDGYNNLLLIPHNVWNVLFSIINDISDEQNMAYLLDKVIIIFIQFLDFYQFSKPYLKTSVSNKRILEKGMSKDRSLSHSLQLLREEFPGIL